MDFIEKGKLLKKSIIETGITNIHFQKTINDSQFIAKTTAVPQTKIQVNKNSKMDKKSRKFNAVSKHNSKKITPYTPDRHL